MYTLAVSFSGVAVLKIKIISTVCTSKASTNFEAVPWSDKAYDRLEE